MPKGKSKEVVIFDIEMLPSGIPDRNGNIIDRSCLQQLPKVVHLNRDDFSTLDRVRRSLQCSMSCAPPPVIVLDRVDPKKLPAEISVGWHLDLTAVKKLRKRKLGMNK